MSQDGSWQEHDKAMPQLINVAAQPPCTLDVQVTHEHELEFHFDATGHVSKVVCSCGAEGTVQML